MKTYIKFCEKCGEPFTAKRKHKMYCSDKCRNSHYVIKKRLKKRLEKQKVYEMRILDDLKK